MQTSIIHTIFLITEKNLVKQFIRLQKYPQKQSKIVPARLAEGKIGG
jgi:hypothetical protein